MRDDALHHLLDFSRQLSTGASVEQVIAAALDGVMGILSPDLALLYLRDGETLALKGMRPVASGFKDVGKEVSAVGRCLCGLAGTGIPVYSQDIHSDPRCIFNDCKQAGIRSFAALPLPGSDGVIGVLSLASFAQRDFHEHAPFLETLAGFSALALQNITQQLRTGESEHNFRMFFETAIDGVLIADAETKRFIAANDAICRMLGYTREELLTLGVKDIHREPDLPRVIRLFESMIRGEMQVAPEVPLLRKDGTTLYADISAPLITYADRACLAGIFRDATDRKRAEEALRLSEARLERILESIKDGFFVLDREWRYSYVNTSAAASSYRTTAALLGKRIWDLDPGLIGGPFHEACHRARAGEVTVQRDVYYEPLKKWYDLTVYPFEDGVSVYFRDITAQKRAEEEQQKLVSLIENSADMIGIATLDGEVVYLNNARKQLVGIDSLEDVQRTRISDYIVPEDLTRFHEEVVPTIQKTGKWTGEIRFKHWKTGETVPVELNGFMIFDRETGRPLAMASISRSIRERKDLEAQLLQAQKMEAVGQLAGGIAHDFNNILTAIIGYGSILSVKLERDNPLRTYVDTILSSADRAANLTHGLLAFSRKQVIRPRPVDVNGIVRSIEKLLLRLIGEDIELKITLAGEDLVVMADHGQIDQVLMNLATNARDAMPRGGTLTIGTESVQFDDDYVRTHGYGKIGGYALISVSDTGMGMSPEIRERIFDPFFTTKEAGKGTGLGLAITYGIVKQHEGFINLYSEAGKGTTFRIYLPMTGSDAFEQKRMEEIRPARGTETVLLCEDDNALRTMLGLILRDFGYTVITAADGDDALRKFREHADRVQLLLTDVIMPKKNGKEVYDAIRQMKPDMKALFISGYTADVINQKGMLDQGVNFIYKPVSPNALLRKVREVLDR